MVVEELPFPFRTETSFCHRDEEAQSPVAMALLRGLYTGHTEEAVLWRVEDC